MANELKPTILVVEDEALILMGTVDFLEEAGFTCLEAHDAAEASQLLNSHPEIAAVFTDIEMSGTRNGLDLAQEAHRLRPHIALVLASGRICPVSAQMPPKSIFIAKPYQAKTVTGVLHDLLAA